MKKVRISADALCDLNEGFLFYEQQEIGLGDYYASSLRADIEELKITGGRSSHCLSEVSQKLIPNLPVWDILSSGGVLGCSLRRYRLAARSRVYSSAID